MSEHRSSPTRSRRGRAPGLRTTAGLLAILALVATACGTRLSGEERAEAKGRGGQLLRTGSGGDAADGLALDAGSEPGSSGAGELGGDEAELGGAGASSGDGDGGSGGEGTPAGAPAAGQASGEPLLLGAVGTFSGPGGAAWKPMVEMLQVWVRDVNGRGGVDGRNVKLSVVDDGGDPARHMSAVRDLVENQGVFAFVGNAISTSYSNAVRDYLEKNGIPVVGGDVSNAVWDSSPMFFPQGTSQANQAPSHVATAKSLRPQATRWGHMTCREAQGCKDVAAAYPALVQAQGMRVAYKAEISIAQPDFTAECLGARNADVEVLAVAVDPNAMRRVAQSCARQSFRPTYILPSAVVASTQDGDGNLEGALGVLPNAPWMDTSNPGGAAMHQAVQRYAPNLKLNMMSAGGWAAGLMFEKAVQNAGGLGEPASRQRLIDGLHRFDGETLGGVSPPLTFRTGQPKDNPCWFAVEFKGGKWTPAYGGKHHCP